MTDTKSTLHVNQYHSECFQSLMHTHIIMCDMTTWLYVCNTNCKTLSKILWIFLRIEITHPIPTCMISISCLRWNVWEFVYISLMSFTSILAFLSLLLEGIVSMWHVTATYHFVSSLLTSVICYCFIEIVILFLLAL